MATDWELIREMMRTAIDACERLEALGVTEQDRDAWVDVGGQKVSIFEFLTSAWVYPERVRYQIIRERHEKGADLPYVPETGRILVNMAQACAELVGVRDVAPAEADCRKMMRWYTNHAVPGVQKALEGRRSNPASSSPSG